MNLYSYVVARDYGFAPNPFGKYCTLATCKPGIRKKAVVGDWIVGTGSERFGYANKIIYAMKVSEKMTFDEYWSDPRFKNKKPVMNGSLKQMFGDNVYHHEEGKWIQVDSHHSLEDGSVNLDNLKKDTQTEFILVSDDFYYFGNKAIDIPPKFCELPKKGPGHKANFSKEFKNGFVKWIRQQAEKGFLGEPVQFTRFERYDGKS